MNEINGRLLQYEKCKFEINHRRKFDSQDGLSSEDLVSCINFSYDMAYGEGWHRNKRSGGGKVRKPGEIFIDTFQGKLAEFALYRYLSKRGINTTFPDIKIEGRGMWDSFDLECSGLHIAVKSTKYYGNLLLLETQDWNEKGEYIPNADAGIAKYDFFVLLRLFPDGEKEMKNSRLLYSQKIEKKRLSNVILSKDWKYDVAGYITNKDLIRLIQKRYILPQGSLLNGRITMDAENYYVQAGDMRRGEDLAQHIRKIEQMFEY